MRLGSLKKKNFVEKKDEPKIIKHRGISGGRKEGGMKALRRFNAKRGQGKYGGVTRMKHKGIDDSASKDVTSCHYTKCRKGGEGELMHR